MKKLCLGFLVATSVWAGEFTMRTPLCDRLQSAAFDREALASKIAAPAATLGISLAEGATGKSPNQLLSPWSLYAVLAMLESGASGKTRDELRRLLYRDGAAERAELVADAMASVQCANESSTTVVHSANRLFLEKSLALVPDYFATLERLFGATAGRVDYQGQPETAAREINDWVSKHTNGKIPSIVDKRQIDRETRLILVNALYLFGTWWKKFDPKATKPGPFKVSGGKTKQVPLMQVKGNEMDFRYAKVGGMEALEMGFADRSASVLVLLPEAADGLPALRRKLDGQRLGEIRKALTYQRVNLTLPRFQLSQSHDLGNGLKALGARSMFERGTADFAGIDGGKHLLYVAAVLQKVTVDVTELGFEGAAATAAMMAAGSGPPKPSQPIEFKVDRPFAFVVESTASEVPLFVGFVQDPTLKE